MKTRPKTESNSADFKNYAGVCCWPYIGWICRPATRKAAAEVAKFDDLRLCNAERSAGIELCSMGPNRPGYHDKWISHEAMKREISSRHLNCVKLSSAIVAPERNPEFNPIQKQVRASAVCRIAAQRSLFVAPDAVEAMCLRDAGASPAKCTNDLRKFNDEAQKLTGAARAEYIELSNGFRMGCNQS